MLNGCKVTIFFVFLHYYHYLLSLRFSIIMALYSFISLFIGGLRGSEIIIIALVILLLFGGRKIPELMRGIGKGVKSFRQGMKEVGDELNSETDSDSKNNSDK